MITDQEILFLDDNYLVANKMSGIPAHATRDTRRPHFFAMIQTYLRGKNILEGEVAMHHRLDLETSGVMIFSLSAEARKVLDLLFKERKIFKFYHGVVVNHPVSEHGIMEDFLAPDKNKKQERMIKVERGGQKAITHFKMEKSWEHSALLHFELLTGRKHQIRVQCALRGMPIVGDKLYGDQIFNQKFSVSRQMLHASQIVFRDPISGKLIDVKSPHPFQSWPAK